MAFIIIKEWLNILVILIISTILSNKRIKPEGIIINQSNLIRRLKRHRSPINTDVICTNNNNETSENEKQVS